MAKSVAIQDTFPFYAHLRDFYVQNRGRIRQHYRELSRKYLDFNSAANANAFLRQPQFEALEMYIFLKEFLNNEPVHQIFKEWSERVGPFAERGVVATYDGLGQVAQLGMFEEPTREIYESRVQQHESIYARLPQLYLCADHGHRQNHPHGHLHLL